MYHNMRLMYHKCMDLSASRIFGTSAMQNQATVLGAIVTHSMQNHGEDHARISEATYVINLKVALR